MMRYLEKVKERPYHLNNNGREWYLCGVPHHYRLRQHRSKMNTPTVPSMAEA